MSGKPATTRLPYTTLFRSVTGQAGGDLAADRIPQEIEVADDVQDLVADELVGEAELGVDHLVLPHEEDRKSTRLNSSHLVNSYAVFCLKKKRHTKQSRQQD